MGRTALVLASAAALTLSGCATRGGDAPETYTQTVVASGATASLGDSKATQQSGGAPITVIDPPSLSRTAGAAPPSGAEADQTGDAGTADATGSSSPGAGSPGDSSPGGGAQDPAAGGDQPGSDTAPESVGVAGDSEAGAGTAEGDGSGSTGTSANALPATTNAADARVARAVSRVLATGCDGVLRAKDLDAALPKDLLVKALPADMIRVEDVANPDNGMTGRTKCYYGTSDIGAARPLVVALAGFSSPEAGQRQLAITVASEKDLGARAVTPTVNGHPATVLLRDGGMLLMRQGSWTLSIALAEGVIPAGQLSPALQKLASAVLKNVGS